MPLSRDNQQWIRDEIDKAVKAALVSIQSPSRARRTLTALRDIGLVAIIYAVPLALLAITVTLMLRVVSDNKDEASFRTRTADTLIAVDGRLKSIESTLLALRVSRAADFPTDKRSQKEATDVLAAARKSTALPVSVVEDAGKSFLNAAKSDPNAWKVALDFVAYKSFLNPPRANDLEVQVSAGGLTNYILATVKGSPEPTLRWGGPMVKPDLAAKWDWIGHDQNVDNPNQPTWLFANGGAASLDGVQIRNAILTGVEVHYSGAPLILQNVFFINCTFVMDNVSPGRDLGLQILAELAVNFRYAG